jgi:hypothetical protein
MTPIESAVTALRLAADALDQTPTVLRRTTQPGLWLGSTPPLVTPKLLRDEADHIERLAAEVRAADATPDEGHEAGHDEEGRRWFGPMWQGWPEDGEEIEPATTFVTNVYVGGVDGWVPTDDEVADDVKAELHRLEDVEGRRRVRDNPQA